MINQASNSKEKPIAPIIALSIARFVTQPMTIISGLLLIEIASTFTIDVGIAAQMRTLASTIAMLFAIAMGVLSV